MNFAQIFIVAVSSLIAQFYGQPAPKVRNNHWSEIGVQLRA